MLTRLQGTSQARQCKAKSLGRNAKAIDRKDLGFKAKNIGLGALRPRPNIPGSKFLRKNSDVNQATRYKPS